MTSIVAQLPLFARDTKACRVCDVVLPLDRFRKRASGSRRNECRTCESAAHAVWVAAHPERARAIDKASYVRNYDRKMARKTAWEKAHPEIKRQRMKAWQQANPGKLRANNARRMLRIQINGGHYTRAEWEAMKMHYGYRCLMCGRVEPDIALTFDHVVPLSRGGSNTISNGQPLCSSCNKRKHTRVIDLR